MKNIINLDGINIINSLESSSKGNQPKVFQNGYWYKTDHMGYEGLSESIISKLLEKTNISDFVSYSPVIILRDGKEKPGCVSINFKKENESIFTLEHLFRAYTGKSLAGVLSEIPLTEDRISFTIDFVKKHTALANFGQYLTAMLQLDTFFLNEDRHTNNIAVIRNDDTKEYRLCPFFDFGLSLLSDINDYPENEDIFELIKKVTAKPFSLDFDEQADAAEKLFGSQLEINFTKQDIINISAAHKEYYSEKIINRITDLLLSRHNKFSYLIQK